MQRQIQELFAKNYIFLEVDVIDEQTVNLYDEITYFGFFNPQKLIDKLTSSQKMTRSEILEGCEVGNE